MTTGGLGRLALDAETADDTDRSSPAKGLPMLVRTPALVLFIGMRGDDF